MIAIKDITFSDPHSTGNVNSYYQDILCHQIIVGALITRIGSMLNAPKERFQFWANVNTNPIVKTMSCLIEDEESWDIPGAVFVCADTIEDFITNFNVCYG